MIKSRINIQKIQYLFFLVFLIPAKGSAAAFTTVTFDLHIDTFRQRLQIEQQKHLEKPHHLAAIKGISGFLKRGIESLLIQEKHTRYFDIFHPSLSFSQVPKPSSIQNIYFIYIPSKKTRKNCLPYNDHQQQSKLPVAGFKQ